MTLAIRTLSLLLAWAVTVAFSPGAVIRIPGPVRQQSSGNTLLVFENFEGTGYDNATGPTWTENGTPNEDYTASPLKGSQSLDLTGGNYPEISFAGQSSVWFHCRLRLGVAATNTILQLDNTADTVLAGLHTTTAGSLIKFNCGGGLSAASATTYSLTTYYVWIHWVSGGTSTLYMSTTTTRPTSDGSGEVVLTATGASDTLTKFIPYAGGGSGNLTVDNIIIQTAAIGDNPSP